MYVCMYVCMYGRQWRFQIETAKGMCTAKNISIIDGKLTFRAKALRRSEM